MIDEIRPETRTRMARVLITEDRCVVCGKWRRRVGNVPCVTCGPSHRRQLNRIRERGDWPKYAAEKEK